MKAGRTYPLSPESPCGQSAQAGSGLVTRSGILPDLPYWPVEKLKTAQGPWVCICRGIDLVLVAGNSKLLAIVKGLLPGAATLVSLLPQAPS